MNTPYRLRIKDAAEQFGVSYSALHRAIRADELPALNVKSRWLVKPDDVEAWLQRIGTNNGYDEAAS